MTFAQLLREIEKIDKIERIRFMTSHPKDLSDEMIEVMHSQKKSVVIYHLLCSREARAYYEKMNRRYTKEHYLKMWKSLERQYRIFH